MSTQNDMSLMTIIKQNPLIVERVQKLSKEVRKDKSKILSMADEYNNKYKDEISEGTRKRHKLLTEGTMQGKTVAEVEKTMGFIPSVYTPILNWLYFFMKDWHNADTSEILREEQDELYKLLLHEQQDVENMNKVPEMFVHLSGKITHDQYNKLKKLKRLATKNSDEHEAFQAYRACLKLCERYDIEFDKILI